MSGLKVPDQPGVEPDPVLAEENGPLNRAAVCHAPTKFGATRGDENPLGGLRLEIAVTIPAVVYVNPCEITGDPSVKMPGEAVI